ncbi:hypothetical protein SAMN06264364_11838 [Quadrisphaera granulorum]|uniref:Uncharacterized protein n=1 Tax=Quadrisphaera granulorum TaxID=317664 RepID=A0A316ARF0_9ACTN|nr:hypothetical protein [Quadrisphaera granulorum]PWJ52667.1 hypothetical protein BXY45_11838 [Quadrisphaera granulorum]SZE97489.1 hypothetical protein SAMN06264364_11838 [Quadrisphaera granulorum]
MTVISGATPGAGSRPAGGVQSWERAVRDAGKAYDRASERLRNSATPTGSDGATSRDSAAAVQLAAARLASAQASLAQARAAAAERQAQRQDDAARPAVAEPAQATPQGRLDTYL